MHFCPFCSNLLLVQAGPRTMRMSCQTCAYVSDIRERMEKKEKFQLKKIEDALGGDDAWSSVDKTESKCPYCPNTEAYYMQIQIRSADEPMTTFYKCTKCGKQYSEN